MQNNEAKVAKRIEIRFELVNIVVVRFHASLMMTMKIVTICQNWV